MNTQQAEQRANEIVQSILARQASYKLIVKAVEDQIEKKKLYLNIIIGDSSLFYDVNVLKWAAWLWFCFDADDHLDLRIAFPSSYDDYFLEVDLTNAYYDNGYTADDSATKKMTILKILRRQEWKQQ